MHIRNKMQSPRYERDGIVSYLLVSSWTTGAAYLTTSLVEMSPGGIQQIHSHAPEQCYFIIESEGLMTIGDETRRVVAGDCVFISSHEKHGLRNTGVSVLRYFSAAAPSFGGEKEIRSLWPIDAEDG